MTPPPPPSPLSFAHFQQCRHILNFSVQHELFIPHKLDPTSFANLLGPSSHFAPLQGNTLAILCYVSLAAQYIEGATRTTRDNGLRFKGESAALSTLFETVVLILYVLPFAVGAMDLLRIEKLLSRCPCRCKCQFVRRCFASRGDAHPDRYAKEDGENHARDVNRTRCVAQFLDDLLGVGDFHTERNESDAGDNSPLGNSSSSSRSSRGDSQGDRDGRHQTSSAVDSRFPGINDARDANYDRGGSNWAGGGSGTSSGNMNDDSMHRRRGGGQRDQTAARFKHISRSTAQYIDAVNAAVATLRKSPLSLSWQHLIEMEDRARSLSRLAFSATAPARSKDNLRTVKLSFQNIRSIWKTEVVRGIYEDEGKGGLGVVPSMSGVVACRNAIIAMLVPGANMGSINVGRKAAMGSFFRERSNSGGGAGVGIELTTSADKADGEEKEDGRIDAASSLALVVAEGPRPEQMEDTLYDHADADHVTSAGGGDVLWADVPESKRGVAEVPKLRMQVLVDRVARVDTPRKSSVASGGMLVRGRSRVPAAVAKKAKTEAKKARLDALVAHLTTLGLDLKRSDPSAVPAQGGSAVSLKSLARYIVDGEEDLGWAVQFVKEKRGVV